MLLTGQSRNSSSMYSIHLRREGHVKRLLGSEKQDTSCRLSVVPGSCYFNKLQAVTSCGLTDSCWSELTGFSGLGQGGAMTKFFCGHLVERNAVWLLKAACVFGLWPFPSQVTGVFQASSTLTLLLHTS